MYSFLGATLASETTAAATGKVGVLRRDPMAMQPFCGYNMADYWGHWLEIGKRLKKPPKIFRVNWFRQGRDGKFLWPGFGEILRVLLWIIDRVKEKGAAAETPIGLVPTEPAVRWDGLDLDPAARRTLLAVDPGVWAAEVPEIRAFFERFGPRLPPEMSGALTALQQDLARVAV